MQLSYSVQEVCRLTGIGQTKIYEAINDGLLPAKKFGRRTLILHENLDAFLKNLDDLKNATSQKFCPDGGGSP